MPGEDEKANSLDGLDEFGIETVAELGDTSSNLVEAEEGEKKKVIIVSMVKKRRRGMWRE